MPTPVLRHSPAGSAGRGRIRGRVPPTSSVTGTAPPSPTGGSPLRTPAVRDAGLCPPPLSIRPLPRPTVELDVSEELPLPPMQQSLRTPSVPCASYLPPPPQRSSTAAPLLPPPDDGGTPPPPPAPPQRSSIISTAVPPRPEPEAGPRPPHALSRRSTGSTFAPAPPLQLGVHPDWGEFHSPGLSASAGGVVVGSPRSVSAAPQPHQQRSPRERDSLAQSAPPPQSLVDIAYGIVDGLDAPVASQHEPQRATGGSSSSSRASVLRRSPAQRSHAREAEEKRACDELSEACPTEGEGRRRFVDEDAQLTPAPQPSLPPPPPPPLGKPLPPPGAPSPRERAPLSPPPEPLAAPPPKTVPQRAQGALQGVSRRAGECWAALSPTQRAALIAALAALWIGLFIFLVVCLVALDRSAPQNGRCWADSPTLAYQLVAELRTLGGVRLLNVRSISPASSWCPGCVVVTQAPGADGRALVAEAAVIVADVGAAVGSSMGQGLFVQPGRGTVSTAGDVWVPDSALHQVFRLDRSAAQPGRAGAAVGRLGSAGAAAGELDAPVAAAATAGGGVGVLDTGNCRLSLYSDLGSPAGTLGACGGAVDLGGGLDLAIDTESSIAYVAERERLQRLNLSSMQALPPWGTAAPSGSLQGFRRQLRGEAWEFASVSTAAGAIVTAEGSQVVFRSATGELLCRFGDLTRPRGAALISAGRRVVVAEHWRLLVYSLRPA
eukprot:TRINITY_DN18724_c0_g1_i1.p1 TRINITY_DN18724_c0_g1~~TRINITY_DN18724_c0_g1_i1.p1  ORF type:complete len:745 (+),score=132.10 TRINITY_DN18724_c0_g1_i1:76-2235(+)